MENQNNGQSIQEGKNIAVIAYLTLIGLIIALVMNNEKKNQFASYHIRQSLGLMCTGLALSLVNIIPILGWIVAIIGSICLLIFWISGLLNALNGREKPVPFLGERYIQWFSGVGILMLFMALLSCGSGDSKTAVSGDGINLDRVMEKVNESRASGSKKAETLVKKYAEALDQLFTRDMALAISGYDAADVKEKYSKIMKDPAYHDISYSWYKGRTGKIRGFNQDFPKDDILKLSWLRATTLEQFKHDYHTPTEEEMQKMEKALNENTSNDSKGKVAVEMAKGFADGLSFDEIPNLGEYAVWNNKAKELNVYNRGVQFQVYVDLSNDESFNRERSITLARMILEKL